MDFSIKACDWTKGSSNGFLTGKSDCIVIGIFESQTLSGAALEIDAATKGLLTRIIKAGDMDGKSGTTLFLHEVSGIGASRVLLVGLGKQDAFNQKAYGDAVRAAWRAHSGHQDRPGHVHACPVAGARTLGRLGRARRHPRAARTDRTSSRR